MYSSSAGLMEKLAPRLATLGKVRPTVLVEPLGTGDLVDERKTTDEAAVVTIEVIEEAISLGGKASDNNRSLARIPSSHGCKTFKSAKKPRGVPAVTDGR